MDVAGLLGVPLVGSTKPASIRLAVATGSAVRARRPAAASAAATLAVAGSGPAATVGRATGPVGALMSAAVFSTTEGWPYHDSASPTGPSAGRASPGSRTHRRDWSYRAQPYRSQDARRRLTHIVPVIRSRPAKARPRRGPYRVPHAPRAQWPRRCHLPPVHGWSMRFADGLATTRRWPELPSRLGSDSTFGSPGAGLPVARRRPTMPPHQADPTPAPRSPRTSTTRQPASSNSAASSSG